MVERKKKFGVILIIVGLLVGSLVSKASTLTTAATAVEPAKKLSDEFSASYPHLLNPWNYSWSADSSYSFEHNLSLLENESFEGIGCWSLKLRASGDQSASPGYLFQLIDRTNERIVSTILLTTTMQYNNTCTLWSTFGSSNENPTSSNLSLFVSWSNSFDFREGSLFIEKVSLSFTSFPEMNGDCYTPFFPNSSLYIALDAMTTEVFFAVTIWISSLFALDNNSNLSMAKFELTYDLIPENTGYRISKGSLSAQNIIIGADQQNYLAQHDLLEGINCSTSWEYQFIPHNHTLFFKINLQGTGKWFFKLNSIYLKSTISTNNSLEENKILDVLSQPDSPLTLFFTIIFLFAPVSIRLSFFKKKPRAEIEEDITSEVILIEDRST